MCDRQSERFRVKSPKPQRVALDLPESLRPPHAELIQFLLCDIRPIPEPFLTAEVYVLWSVANILALQVSPKI